MNLDTSLFFIVLLLSAGLALAPLVQRFNLSRGSALVLVGFVGSEIIVALGFDTGIRWQQVHALIFYALLPIMIFDAAMDVNPFVLRRNASTVAFLSIPLVIFTVFSIAALLYYAINDNRAFPWEAAFFAGALLAATEPMAVLELFGRMQVPKRVRVVLEGESLLNDTISIVIFAVLLTLVNQRMQPDAVSIAVLFFKVLLGGIVLGLFFGAIINLLFRAIKDAKIKSVATLLLVYLAYISAESLFDVSGVMALLALGIWVGRLLREDTPKGGDCFVRSVWDYKAYLASSMAFLLMGITITVGMFTTHWLEMLIALTAVLAVRAVGIYGGNAIMHALPGMNPVGLRYRPVVYLGGIPGAVTIALALSLPLELTGWYTTQSIVYGVVIFYVVMQTPLMTYILRRI
ncbi:MAG: cation:proton antiporter [Gammaproteobacteria bacterium]|nr:cation:proton antiporter [Gammaproteobacteria bacterium]